MTLTDFGSGIADTIDGIFNVLFGKTGMHGDVEFPFVEEFTGFGALIGIIAHAFETGEVEGGLIVENTLHAFFFVENTHEFIAGAAQFLFINADGVEVVTVIAVSGFVNGFDPFHILDTGGDLVSDLTTLFDKHIQFFQLAAADSSLDLIHAVIAAPMSVPRNHIKVSGEPIFDGIGLFAGDLTEVPYRIVDVSQLIVPALGLIAHAAQILDTLGIFIIVGGDHTAFTASGDILQAVETE